MPWLQRFEGRSSGAPALLCFPHAGGCASFFQPWAVGAASRVEVLATQWPGRENRIRESPVTDMATGVRAIADAVEALAAERFAFFGHSLGALIAFEVTREIRRRSARQPVALCVSAAGAPHAPRVLPAIHRLPNQELLQALAERYEAIPRIILNDRELTAFYADLLRADISMLEDYRYTDEERLSCPIFAFSGTHDRVASAASIALWREQTSDHFDLRTYSGGHFFLSEHGAQVLDALSEIVAPARAEMAASWD